MIQLRVLFFFNDTATPEIYTLSLHDALPICLLMSGEVASAPDADGRWSDESLEAARAFNAELLASERWVGSVLPVGDGDRKSTRLNSSHANISYAVFCLKKKQNTFIRVTTCG